MRIILYILLLLSFTINAQEESKFKKELKKTFKFSTFYGAINGGNSISDIDIYSITNGLETDVVELDDLSDVDKVKYIDIAENTEAQDKHEIVVVPTIIVFKDGEEVKRFQADISFSIPATKEEIQEVIDETLMSDF